MATKRKPTAAEIDQREEDAAQLCSRLCEALHRAIELAEQVGQLPKEVLWPLCDMQKNIRGAAWVMGLAADDMETNLPCSVAVNGALARFKVNI